MISLFRKKIVLSSLLVVTLLAGVWFFFFRTPLTDDNSVHAIRLKLQINNSTSVTIEKLTVVKDVHPQSRRMQKDNYYSVSLLNDKNELLFVRHEPKKYTGNVEVIPGLSPILPNSRENTTILMYLPYAKNARKIIIEDDSGNIRQEILLSEYIHERY